MRDMQYIEKASLAKENSSRYWIIDSIFNMIRRAEFEKKDKSQIWILFDNSQQNLSLIALW